VEADLTQLSAFNDQLSIVGGWGVIMAFAVLHHIPSVKLRTGLLHTVRGLLADDGRFILSNWQFLTSEKLRARIQSWKVTGIEETDVDAGDYLLDWRSGGEGLRYVHHFNESELSALARESGFMIRETFYSDGESGKLGLYQVWQANSIR
jgi:(p)ppGpp synthase/HD superfamily hydrolase